MEGWAKVKQIVKRCYPLSWGLGLLVRTVRTIGAKLTILLDMRYCRVDQIQALSRGMALTQDCAKGLLRRHCGHHIAFLITEYEEIGHTGDKHAAISLGVQLRAQYPELVISHYAQHPRIQWRHVARGVDTVVYMDPAAPEEIFENYIGKKHVAWIRGNYSTWINRDLLRHCTHIAVSSTILKDRLLQDGYGAKPVQVVPLGAPYDIMRIAELTPTVPEDAREVDVSFVGNFYHIKRAVADYLDTGEFHFVFYGNLPEGHPWLPYWKGFANHSDLADIYTNSKIVLEDIASFNAGTVNLRTFEAAACGALVIANHDDAFRELFGDLVPTYQTREELNELIRYYLAHPQKRIERARQLQQLVLERYTFQQEARKFYNLIYNTEHKGR